MVDNNAVAGSSTSRPTSDPRSRSRIHFSDDQASRSSLEASPQPSRTGTASPLSRKSTPASKIHGGTSNLVGNDGRRRTRPLIANSLFPENSAFASFPPRRSLDSARIPGGANDPFGFGLDPTLDAFGPGALSDEYDLCASNLI